MVGGEACVANTQEDDGSGGNHMWKGGWEGVVAAGGTRELLRLEVAEFRRERESQTDRMIGINECWKGDNSVYHHHKHGQHHLCLSANIFYIFLQFHLSHHS